MAQVLVRQLEDKVVAALKARARRNNHSLEEELRAILTSVPRAPRSVGFSALVDLVRRSLPAGEIPGGGSIPWYVTMVKLDLEARGELVCDRHPVRQALSRPARP